MANVAASANNNNTNNTNNNNNTNNTNNTNKLSNTAPTNKTVANNVNTNISKKLNAPEFNNTKKETSLNNALNASAINKGNTTTNENVKTTKEEMVEYGKVITNNYLLLVGISAALIICLVIYFFSQSFRVGRTLDNILRYQSFQRLSSFDFDKNGSLRLGNMFIASAYNAAHSGYQMYDYTSEKIVLGILQSGVRYLEFNVFNSVFGDEAYPVVSMGYKKGEWKMMAVDTPLETIFQIIADNAFSISEGSNGVNNPLDPLLIGLNLNTNSNLSCLNLISFLIIKYFQTRLLPNKYSFQHSDDIADITLSNLTLPNNKGGKIVFFASDGFQGSGLEEIINYSWDDIEKNPNHKMKRILYSDLTDPSFDDMKAEDLKEFNKKGLTIVVPHTEGDFFNTNYDTVKAFELGCQFIAMEYQYIDSNMDSYITRFKNSSIILKQQDLR